MRLELLFKSAVDLKAIISMLRTTGICSVNLTNKAKGDPLLKNITTLKGALPQLDICQHYSLKYQYKRDADTTYASFRQFLGEAEQEGVCEVLLLTGSGPKRELNTVTCLQRLREEKSLPAVKLGVAFNPYFPDVDDRREEQQRLTIGSDLEALRQGLDFLKGEDPNGRLRIVGSVLVPSKKLLAQMKFRPWNGVWLSDRYLSSVDEADAITKEIVYLYRQYGVEPLIETAVKENDLDRLRSLLGHDLCVASTASVSQDGEDVGEEDKATARDEEQSEVVASAVKRRRKQK